MKKFLSLAMALILIFSLAACGKEEIKPGVTVTIMTTEGPVVTMEHVNFVDYDEDGKYTIDEALKAAHEKFAPKGSDDYASEDQGYGLTVTKLWGNEDLGCGYYVNNQMAMSALDEVKENDYICAFLRKDPINFSDVYSWFENVDLKASDDKKSADISFNLKGFTGYDESWNPISESLKDVEILLDGESTNVKTDANGHASLSKLSKGSHVITLKDANGMLFNGAAYKCIVE